MVAHAHRLTLGNVHAWRYSVNNVCTIQLLARAASQFSIMWPAQAQAEAIAHLQKDNVAQCRGGKPG